MANERINSVVAPVAYDEIDRLIAKLLQAEKTIESFSDLKIGGEKSISKVNAAMQELGNTTLEVKEISKEVFDAEKRQEQLRQQRLRTQKAELQVKNQQIRNEKQLLTQKKALDREAQREQKIISDLTNDYKILSQNYRDTSLRAKNYALQLGENHPLTLQAAQDARELRATLERLDATTGSYSRSLTGINGVGAQFNQLLREAPNAGISFRTFLISITNNISYFFEAIKNARAAGQSWTQIIGTMGRSLTGVVGIVNLAVLAITAFGVSALSAKDDTEELTEATDDLTKAIADNIKQLRERRELRREFGDQDTESESSLKRQINLLRAQGASLAELRDAERQYNELRRENRQDELNAVESIIRVTNDLFNRYRIRNFTLAAQQKAVTEDLIATIVRQTGVTIAEATKTAEAITKTYIENNGVIVGLEEKRAALIRDIRDLENEENAASIRFQRELLEDLAEEDEAILKEREKAYEDYLKKVEKQAKRSAQLRAQLLKEQSNADLEDLEGIASNEQESLDRRLLAAASYYSSRIFLIENARKQEIDAANGNAEQIDLINATFQLRTNQELQRYYDRQNEIRESAHNKEFQDTLSSIGQISTARISNQNAELMQLRELYDMGTINAEEFANRRLEITNRYQSETLQNQFSFLQEQLNNAQLTGEQREQLQVKLNEVLNSLYKEDADNYKRTEEEKRTQINFTLNLVRQFSQAFQEVIKIQSDALKAQSADLAERNKQLEANSEREIISIQRSTLSEEEKQERIQQVEAETEAQRSSIQAQQREANRRRAQADKQAALAQITINTASAIIKAFLDYSGPVAVAAAAAIGALGAAQFARASAAPLPQYATGTLDHKGGAFIAGERESELVVRPDGKMYWTDNKPSVYNEPKHTQVFNQEQIKDILSAGITPKMATVLIQNPQSDYTNREVRDAVKDSSKQIVRAIYKNKAVQRVNIKGNDNYYRARRGLN